MSGTIITPSLVKELSENESIMHWMKEASEIWVSALADVIDEALMQESRPVSVSSESLARGIIALRDGLYGSLSAGHDLAKVRKAWVEVIGFLLQQLTSH